MRRMFGWVRVQLNLLWKVSRFFIGLNDRNGSGGGDPLRFQLDDNTSTDLSFFDRGGEYPWHNNEPNDVGGRENCVE